MGHRFSWPPSSLTRSKINIYSPACLIVGTRGRSLGGIQGLLPGSVSKYCLQNSPVPVIVVRPTAKRDKKKRKRLADPNRRTYMGILEQSGANGSQMLHKSERDKLIGQHGGDPTEKEAEAVAQAIGLPGTFSAFRKPVISVPAGGGDDDGAPLTKVASTKSDHTSPESPSPSGGLLFPDSPFGPELRSPELQGWESPGGSDDEDEDGEEGDDEDEEDRKRGSRRGKSIAVDAARKMEAGEGRYLKRHGGVAEAGAGDEV